MRATRCTRSTYYGPATDANAPMRVFKHADARKSARRRERESAGSVGQDASVASSTERPSASSLCRSLLVRMPIKRVYGLFTTQFGDDAHASAAGAASERKAPRLRITWTYASRASGHTSSSTSFVRSGVASTTSLAALVGADCCISDSKVRPLNDQSSLHQSPPLLSRKTNTYYARHHVRTTRNTGAVRRGAGRRASYRIP